MLMALIHKYVKMNDLAVVKNKMKCIDSKFTNKKKQ